MTRAEFIDKLRRGLRGAPLTTIDAIVSDYESYFADAAAHGRAETDVASALGNPARIAAELRLDLRTRDWRARPSAGSALRVASSVLALGTADLLLFVPLSVGFVVVFAAYFASFIGMFSGAYLLITAPFTDPAAGVLATALRGLGGLTGGIAGIAITTLVCIPLVNAVTWLGGWHRRVLKPLSPSSAKSLEAP